MLIRSLTLATLMVFTGPLLAADDTNPLKQDVGKARPLVVVELDSGNATLTTLKKQLDDPANKQAFEQRNMVFYTVKFGSIAGALRVPLMALLCLIGTAEKMNDLWERLSPEKQAALLKRFGTQENALAALIATQLVAPL